MGNIWSLYALQANSFFVCVFFREPSLQSTPTYHRVENNIRFLVFPPCPLRFSQNTGDNGNSPLRFHCLFLVTYQAPSLILSTHSSTFTQDSWSSLPRLLMIVVLHLHHGLLISFLRLAQIKLIYLNKSNSYHPNPSLLWATLTNKYFISV